MSNYEYSASSSGTGASGNAGAGFDAAKAIFSQVDTNQDGTVDRNEFQQWVSGAGRFSAGAGAGQYEASALGGAGSNFEASSYESSGYSAGGGGGAYSAESGLAAAGGISSYESSGVALDAGAGNFQSSSSSSTFESGAAGFDASVAGQAANYSAESNAAWSRYGAEVRGAGLYFDANPQIIRRQAAGGVQTYTQNIKVRFLQPPPIPPPGVRDALFSRP
jgi:hypothetical protein